MTRMLGITAVALAVFTTAVSAQEDGFELVLTSNIVVAYHQVGGAKGGDDLAGLFAIKASSGQPRHGMVSFEFAKPSANLAAPKPDQRSFEMGSGYFDYDDPAATDILDFFSGPDGGLPEPRNDKPVRQFAEAIYDLSSSSEVNDYLEALGSLGLLPPEEHGLFGTAFSATSFGAVLPAARERQTL